MDNFEKFIKSNKEKIYRIAESNTFRNKDNIPAIKKDDTWREETEWEEVSQEMLEKNIESYKKLSSE